MSGPTLEMIATTPSFDIACTVLDARQRGLNDVGGLQAGTQSIGHFEPVKRQGFFQAFGQTSRGAGIETLEMIDHAMQCSFRVAVAVHCVGGSDSPVDVGLMNLRKML